MLPPEYHTSTFSIVAYDPDAQEWGVAVQSKAFAVGSMVPWAQAGVGAVASQAWTNKTFGASGLKLLKQGRDPKDVIEHLISADPGGSRRQLALVDAQGRTANYTGNECQAWAGGIAEPNVSVQGNILVGERVLTNMLRAYIKTTGKLAERLIAALVAGQKAGGDTRGQQSASLLVVRAKSDINGVGDRYVDLRVDDHKTPIEELQRLYSVWQVEMYPLLESQRINALLKAKHYARAQKMHRDFSATAQQLARKHPKNAILHNALAWFFAQNSLGLDASLRYAQRAVKLKPGDVDILDTLAEVYYQRGNAPRAVEIERPIAKKYPERVDFDQQLAKFEKAANSKTRQGTQSS